MKIIYFIPVAGLLLSATAAGVTVLYSRLNRTNSGGSKQILRITAFPPAKLQKWVPQAWVGVRMPLATRGPGVRSARVVGVLSGPHSFLAQLKQFLSGRGRREQGYCVRVTDGAVEALVRARPEAAQWWLQSAPHLVRPGKIFLFPEYCGVIEPDDRII